jgi:hypothetical protein
MEGLKKVKLWKGVAEINKRVTESNGRIEESKVMEGGGRK